MSPPESNGRRFKIDIQWYTKGDNQKERKLVNKLDRLIVPYAFLAYWVKYIDQANISQCTRILGNQQLTLQRQCIRLRLERRPWI